MARFTDFLAGGVVGGALIATGVLLAKHKGEEMHVTMLKDNSAAMVWAVDRGSGKARFVSWEMVPAQVSREMTVEGLKRLGEILAGDNLLKEVHAADRARLAQNKPGR